VFMIQAKEQGLQFKVTYEEGAPRSLKGDPTRVRQILINLLGNAMKFTEKGSVSVSGCVEQQAEGDWLHLSVEDTGIGMTQEQSESIFKAFRQADYSTTRKYGGTGLGLSITRQLVDKMEGDIQVSSEFGQGTRFDVSIRVEVLDGQQATSDDASANEVTERSHERFEHYKHQVCEQVLVAEDNRVNQMVIRKFLEKLGISAHMVENGLEAVKYCEQHSPQLVLMDCEMPEMDGLTATRTLRKQAHHTMQPIIIGLSAHAMKEHEEQGLSAGMDDYLTKPITLDRLESTLLSYFKALPKS